MQSGQLTPQTHPIVFQVRSGDFTGLNIVGGVRLSFEVKPGLKYSDRPTNGREIDNRAEQEHRNRVYVESRGGTYLGTINEANTSAWKKKKVRQVDDEGHEYFIYRVIRPKYERFLINLKRGTIGTSVVETATSNPEAYE